MANKRKLTIKPVQGDPKTLKRISPYSRKAGGQSGTRYQFKPSKVKTIYGNKHLQAYGETVRKQMDNLINQGKGQVLRGSRTYAAAKETLERAKLKVTGRFRPTTEKAQEFLNKSFRLNEGERRLARVNLSKLTEGPLKPKGNYTAGRAAPTVKRGLQRPSAFLNKLYSELTPQQIKEAAEYKAKRAAAQATAKANLAKAGTGKLKVLGKGFIGRAAGPAAGGVEFISNLRGRQTSGQNPFQSVAGAGSAAVGTAVGFSKGAVQGARLGARLGPKGAAVGGVVGGLAGAAVGSGIFQAVSDTITGVYAQKAGDAITGKNKQDTKATQKAIASRAPSRPVTATRTQKVPVRKPATKQEPKLVGPKLVGPKIVGPKLVGPKIVGPGRQAPVRDYFEVEPPIQRTTARQSLTSKPPIRQQTPVAPPVAPVAEQPLIKPIGDSILNNGFNAEPAYLEKAAFQIAQEKYFGNLLPGISADGVDYERRRAFLDAEDSLSGMKAVRELLEKRKQLQLATEE